MVTRKLFAQLRVVALHYISLINSQALESEGRPPRWFPRRISESIRRRGLVSRPLVRVQRAVLSAITSESYLYPPLPRVCIEGATKTGIPDS